MLLVALMDLRFIVKIKKFRLSNSFDGYEELPLFLIGSEKLRSSIHGINYHIK